MERSIGDLAKGVFSSWQADLWGREGIASQRRGLLGAALGRFDDKWERHFRVHVRAVTAINQELRRRSLALGFAPDRILYLPPGANINLITPLSKPAVRCRLGIPDLARVAVYAGFAPYDAPFLGAVIGELLRQDPGCHVVTTGSILRLPGRLRDNREVSSRIHELGSLPFSENAMVLPCADLFLLPYRDSGVNRGRFPNKFGDYLSAGRPIVSNPTGDVGAIIAREGLGVLAGENATEFAAAAVALMVDVERCEAMGQRARQYAERTLAWSHLAREVESFYFTQLNDTVGPASSVDNSRQP